MRQRLLLWERNKISGFARAWMGGGIDLFQMRKIKPRILLRRGKRRMPQKLLKATQIGTIA
jgi:hypothetical protein